MILATALVFSAPGCKQADVAEVSTDGALAPVARPADGSLLGDFDPAAEAKALEGVWRVKDSASAKEPSQWTVQGGKLTIQSGDRRRDGTLEVTMPGELAFVQQEQGGTSREFFAYARDGDQVYIGLGVAGVKLADRMMLRDDGLVVFQAGACKFHGKKMFGGFEAPVDVQCSLAGDVFSYQVPDRFKPGEVKAGSARLSGNLLLDDQMQGHRAEKAGP